MDQRLSDKLRCESCFGLTQDDSLAGQREEARGPLSWFLGTMHRRVRKPDRVCIEALKMVLPDDAASSVVLVVPPAPDEACSSGLPFETLGRRYSSICARLSNALPLSRRRKPDSCSGLLERLPA